MRISITKDKEIDLLTADNVLVRKLIEQVEKDFQLAGIPLEPHAEVRSVQEFLKELDHHINEVAREDFGKLANLYYRVDVPEDLWMNALSNKGSFSQINALTALLIERELQKVVRKMQNNSKT